MVTIDLTVILMTAAVAFQIGYAIGSTRTRLVGIEVFITRPIIDEDGEDWKKG